MTRKQKRLAVIGGGMSFIIAAVLLIMFAFSNSVAYFYMPGDLASANIGPGTRIRLGGLVADGSVVRGQGSTVTFNVTDGKGNVPVSYTGILPDLFREGQGASPKVPSIPAPTISLPIACWPSMMRNTCPPKSPTV